MTSIQYLRGIAALMVVWQHGLEQLSGLSGYFPRQFGSSGVDIFFQISGFIMVITTLGTDTTSARFFIKRLIRVVPLYWLATLTMIVIWLARPALLHSLNVTFPSVIESLLMIPYYSTSYPDQIWPLLIPGWTLNLEMFFYLLFSLTLLLRVSARAVALVASLMAFVLVGIIFGPFESAPAQLYTDPILIQFACGALLGVLWKRQLITVSPISSWVLFTAGIVFLYFRNTWPLGSVTQLIGATILLIGSISGNQVRYSSKVLSYIGDSSYSLYLSHLFTLGMLRVIWVKLSPAALSFSSAASFMFLGLALSSVIGYIVYKIIEKPMLRALKHLVFRPLTKRAAIFRT